VADLPSPYESTGLAHLAAAGWNVEVVYLGSPDGLAFYDPELGATRAWESAASGAVTIAPTRTSEWLRFARRVTRAERVVVAGYGTGRLIVTLFLALLMARGRAVTRSDSVRAGKFVFAKRAVYRLLASRGGRGAAVGKASERVLTKHFGLASDKVLRMPYLLPPAAMAQAPSAPATRPKVMAAFRFVHREGALVMVEVLRTISTRRPDVDVVVAGDAVGDLADEVRALLSGHPGIRYLGWVPYSEYLRELATAHVYVHLPLDEPWGTSLVDAAALGVPMVTTPTCFASQDLAPIVGEGMTVVPTGACDAAVDAVLNQLAGSRISQAAIEQVRREFAGSTWVEALGHPSAVAPPNQ